MDAGSLLNGGIAILLFLTASLLRSIQKTMADMQAEILRCRDRLHKLEGSVAAFGGLVDQLTKSVPKTAPHGRRG